MEYFKSNSTISRSCNVLNVSPKRILKGLVLLCICKKTFIHPLIIQELKFWKTALFLSFPVPLHYQVS